ncbi:unnamed protein product [Phytomonas sp. Hart1]|nr:unnamed protein product [Phytomonas sp. Hart1]|eukprot:CCW72308.1 unnamed protein product [Phytomonas sp. isolate Hart1]
MPNAQVLLRIRTNDQAAQCAFSAKFGADLREIPTLLATARRLNLDIYGVSFHVGSGNTDVAAYCGAIRDAHAVFELAAAEGFNCTMLDIGGGFPGTLPGADDAPALSFEAIAAAIAPLLTELFPNTTIVSEPGRFFTAASHLLAMNVFAMRTVRVPGGLHEALAAAAETALLLPDPDGLDGDANKPTAPGDALVEYQYYVNDGVYDSFNCLLFDHAHPKLVLLDDADGADAAGGLPPAYPHPFGPTAAAALDNKDRPDDDDNDEFGEAPAWPFAGLRDAALRRRACPRRPLRLTTIFGPTCDSLDCILKRRPFPEMGIGDWVLAFDMGSYTTAAGSAFNGFKTRQKIYVSSAIV